jgi:phosphoglycolate phosphatase
MARVGATPAETVFVGDSRHDVETARRAGVAAVAVTWGLASREELVRAGAKAFAQSAAELAPWVA